eukprot:TRINITY_DN471_c0_g1_i1.p1 TRINITY_DN471_c0_g1~~TRINITY_DN471_c0_g1_i1.p1  ORF type:complete len:212 (+),score=68.18 TRINITY_DN471_c0_g1_i1:115-750(+)
MCIRDRYQRRVHGGKLLIQTQKEQALDMATKVLHPPMKWAQRKDKIFLSIEIRDIQNEKVELKEPNNLIFSCESEKQQYESHLEFYGEIDVNESRWTKYGRYIQLVIQKKEEGPYWKKLTKDDKKYSNISVDWDKYVDEDEEAEQQQSQPSFGEGWDPSAMQGFGGQGEEDSDDEEEHGHDHGIDDLDKEEEINTGDNKEANEDENEEKKE